MKQVHASRLDYLDGLRALAVLLVMMYHYLHFWTSAGEGENLVAFDDAWSWLPGADIGYIGVHLFFIISGFVILLTLERSHTLGEFLLNRVTRLWPPLILLGTVTFLFVNAFGPEELRASLPEYVISLFFMPPQHIALLHGHTDWNWLDGAYWSLHVEIKFYLMIGALYFFGRGSFLPLWLAFQAAAFALWVASTLTGNGLLDLAEGFLFQRQIPYFTLGMAGYLYFQGQRRRLLAAAAIASLLHILAAEGTAWLGGMTLTSAFVRILFAELFVILTMGAFVLKGWRLPTLSSRPVAAIGRGSYGTYLIHQNVGVSILALGAFSHPLVGGLGALTLMVVILLVGVLSFNTFERPVQAALRRLLLRADRHAGAAPH